MRDESYVTLDDGCVQVCLSQEQWQVCCFVSSHHLIAEKWPQLHRALDKMATPLSDLEQ